MQIVQYLNLGIRFLLELCMLVAFGAWGFQLDRGWPLRIAAGIGVPLLVAAIWGVFVSPKATIPLAEPWRFGLEALLFGLAASALYLAQRPSLAILLFTFFFINRLLMTVWHQ